MGAPPWTLSCAHSIARLEHDRADVLPSRPRMCPTCGRLRDVVPSRELVCVECGATSEDGAGWKAEVAPDLLERIDNDEVAVYCARCWAAEFGD